MNKAFSKAIIFVSIGIFAVSLTQTAYCTTNLCRGSLDSFLTGIIGVFYGGAATVWLANIPLLFAWLTIIKIPSLSLVLSLVAIVISLSFLRYSSIVDNEAGHINRIISYGLGYWLWLASSATMTIGNLVSYFSSRKK